jgi:primase-polymerase (primpol)-like protein
MESIVETPALEDMKEYDHWLMWKMVDGRKVPVSFADCKSGSTSMYEKTWCSYEKAKEALQSGKFTGIGFVFNEDNPYVGVDLDKCRDKETGEIDEWAQKIITEINSYTELSPSGTGVHIISNGNHVPVGHNPRG